MVSDCYQIFFKTPIEKLTITRYRAVTMIGWFYMFAAVGLNLLSWMFKPLYSGLELKLTFGQPNVPLLEYMYVN